MSVTATSVCVEPRSPELHEMAHRAALRHTVPPHEVLVRLLLHLPRDADPEGMVDARLASTESERLAAELASATARYSAWQEPPTAGQRNVTDLDLTVVDEGTARVVLERFHYLGSFRPRSQHFGGVVRNGDEVRLAALLTVSGLDVPTIAARLPNDVEPANVAVLARMFAFDWTPRNTLSFLMARVTRELRRRPDPPRLLMTYLNPNVGFTGASYRAANWVLWAHEGGTRYAYLDGRYTTDRELERRFGSAQGDALRQKLGGRITLSRMSLRPLDLYAYPLDPTLRDTLGVGEPLELPRPVP
jgi:hypothetical protein